MDLFLPGMDGLEATAAIRTAVPETLVLALTSSTDESKVLAAVQAGARGYLIKDASRVELLQAIRELSQGRPYLPPQVTLKLMRSMGQGRPAAAPPSPFPPNFGGLGGRGVRGAAHESPPVEPLTVREKEVLSLLGRGLSNREIADRLHVAEATVRTHVYNILGKLGLEHRSQAVVYAVRQGMTDQADQA
jgi:DNA-binding NarL/FixJ family response regulator